MKFYDLRMKYGNLGDDGTTRNAIEQDFGRACRYIDHTDYMDLSFVLLSEKAFNTTLTVNRKTREREQQNRHKLRH